MSTQLSSQLLAYHAFVKATLSKGGSIDQDATPEAFLEFQRQLDRLREELKPAAERFRHGEEARETDVDQLVEEVLKERSDQSGQP
jgi:hypothetical protein